MISVLWVGAWIVLVVAVLLWFGGSQGPPDGPDDR